MDTVLIEAPKRILKGTPEGIPEVSLVQVLTLLGSQYRADTFLQYLLDKDLR